MASVDPNPITALPVGAVADPAGNQLGRRLVELDILRGFLLLWMTLTHLPTKVSIVSNQTFGFVSGAEGFIFLAAFMVGQLQTRSEGKVGEWGAFRDIARRTGRVYLYHSILLVIAFALFAPFALAFNRIAIQNLLSFYIQSPKEASFAAALLEYRPSLLDILPMYIVFMALTPLARKVAHTRGWKPVVCVSVTVWAAAQLGLRAWLYRQGDIFGLKVPESSTGAFDLYGWQLLWMVGLVLGTTYATRIRVGRKALGPAIPSWLLRLSVAVIVGFLVLRYGPLDHWVDLNTHGWLIDKWHLGPARVINFTAIAIVLIRYGTRIASFDLFAPLAALGQASLEVFCVHILCCLSGDALSRQADPDLPWYQQAALLAITLVTLFLTARFVAWRRSRRQQESVQRDDSESGLIRITR